MRAQNQRLHIRAAAHCRSHSVLGRLLDMLENLIECARAFVIPDDRGQTTSHAPVAGRPAKRPLQALLTRFSVVKARADADVRAKAEALECVLRSGVLPTHALRACMPCSISHCAAASETIMETMCHEARSSFLPCTASRSGLSNARGSRHASACAFPYRLQTRSRVGKAPPRDLVCKR